MCHLLPSLFQVRQQKLFKNVEKRVEQLQQQLVEPIKSLSHLADGYVERFLKVVRVRLPTGYPRLHPECHPECHH